MHITEPSIAPAAKVIFDLINRSFVFNQKEINVIISNEEIWFKAKDVALVLGYKTPQKAIDDHIPLNDRRKLVQLVNHQNGSKEISYQEGRCVYISESGLYEFIFASKLEVAKEFKSWVFKDVLPNIRKLGNTGYSSLSDSRCIPSGVYVNFSYRKLQCN